MIARPLKLIMITLLAVVFFITNLPLEAKAQSFVDLSDVDRSVLPLRTHHHLRCTGCDTAPTVSSPSSRKCTQRAGGSIG